MLLVFAGCGATDVPSTVQAPARDVAADPTAIRPFEVHIPDEVLDELNLRLRCIRYPDELDGADWDYGTSLAYQWVVALTANAMKGDRMRCLEVAMDDYLSKPIKHSRLRRVLDERATAATLVAIPTRSHLSRRPRAANRRRGGGRRRLPPGGPGGRRPTTC